MTIRHPIPVTSRQLMKLCQFYDPKLDIQSILDRIIWNNGTPSQVYAAILGRLPENMVVAVPGVNYSVKQHFENTLTSTEFQENLIKIVAHAFAEKRRLIFVHIPRTAGTDLESNLATSYPLIHHRITVPEDVKKSEMFLNLREFAQNADISDSIFISGHIELKWYLRHRMLRFGDEVFTVVREPTEILISWINYVATVLLENPERDRPDRVRWLKLLNINAIPDHFSESYPEELARLIMYNEEIVGKNFLCSYLGYGTYDSTLDALATCDVEITDIERYPIWLKSKWAIETRTRKMSSSSILSKAGIRQVDYDYLTERTAEDSKLYNRIKQSLEKTGSDSVKGSEL